jgi:catechol 2,3-dioxygenase-like lactoylglutathione lyase family enzyme
MTDARVIYTVRDFDSGRSFYKDKLGFDETLVDFDNRWAELTRDAMHIAVTEGEPAPESETGVAMIDVEDIKAEADRLRSQQVEVGVVLELAGQMRLCDVFDPDGNRIQLAQPLED